MNKNLVEDNPNEGTGPAALHCTSSNAQLENFTFTYAGSTSETRTRLILDFENASPPITGSRSFSAGDHLIFGITSNNLAQNMAISILLSFD